MPLRRYALFGGATTTATALTWIFCACSDPDPSSISGSGEDAASNADGAGPDGGGTPVGDANGADVGVEILEDGGVAPTIGSTCKGDGVADDTACLQGFINNAVAAAKPLAFPSNRTFLIQDQLVVSGGLMIDGNGSTLLLKTPHVMLLIGASQVTVKKLTFDYQSPSGYSGIIDIQPNVANVIIEGCTFLGSKAIAGVHVNNPGISYVTVRGSTFTGVVYGVLTNTTNFKPAELTDLAKHPHHLVIDGNTMTALAGDGVEINSPVYLYQPYNSGTPGVAAHDIEITNNIIHAPASDQVSRGFCIGIAGAKNVKVTGNTLEDCKWQAVHIEDTATLVTVSTNQMRRIIGNKPSDVSGWTSNRSGIISLNARQISILNNIIETTIDEGIDFTYDGVTYNQDVTIAGNTITGAGRYGIFVGGIAGQNLMTLVGPAAGFGGNTSNGALGPIQVAAGATGVTVTGNVNF